MITRRTALKNLALTTGALALSSPLASAQITASEGVFKLPPLGFDYDALEPYIDAETMKLHHDKHHAAYVSKLNEGVAGAPGFEKKSIEEILTSLPQAPEGVRMTLQNQGGGHANHAFFWQMLKKNETGTPKGELAAAIDKTFGSLAKFQEQFATAALGIFGSGWAWLALNAKKLSIETTPNQNSLLMNGKLPILGLDVWEHAYYLKYQNRRPEYVKAFPNVIHWDFVSARYADAMKA